MANSGGTNSNDTQFFINTGSLNSQLGYGYTVFGQLLTGHEHARPDDPDPGDEQHIDRGAFAAGQSADDHLGDAFETPTPTARCCWIRPRRDQGETSTITVTATDPADHTTVTQSFVVTVGAYGGPTSPTINFRPFANATTGNVAQELLGPGAAQRAERISRHRDAEHAHLRAAQPADSRHGQQLQRVDRHVHLHAELAGFSGSDSLPVPGDGDRAADAPPRPR